VDLSDVEHSLDDTIGYLQQVETDLQQLDHVYGDPHFIESHINNVQVCVTSHCWRILCLVSLVNFLFLSFDLVFTFCCFISSIIV